jgi:hypothetical protein
MKISQNIPVWLSKMVLARHFATCSFLRRLAEWKSVVIIMIWLVLPVFDWPIITIRRGGLLLPRNSWWSPTTYLQSQFSFYGWGCRKREREKYVCRVTYILSTSWDARKVLMSASQTPHCSSSTCAARKEEAARVLLYLIANRVWSFLPSFLPWEM